MTAEYYLVIGHVALKAIFFSIIVELLIEIGDSFLAEGRQFTASH